MVNFNDLFSSGDPRTDTAIVNGREVNLTVLAGLADEGLIKGIQNGTIQMSQSALDNLVEVRQLEGKSGLFNFVKGVGQDIGVVSETGVGGLERGGRLAIFAASLFGGGKILSAGKFLPNAGILSQAKNLGSVSSLKNIFSARNVAIAAGGGLATGAIAQGVAGGDETIISPLDVREAGITDDTEALFDAATEAAETGEEGILELPEGGAVDPSNPFAGGGKFSVSPLLNDDGTPTGLVVIKDAAGQLVDYIAEDELPVNNPDQRERQRKLEDFNLAERKFNQTITALNTISSIRSASGVEDRANAQFQIDLANTLADPRSAAILRAGIARQPQGSSVNPLLAAFTDTKPGDLTLSNTGLTGQLAELFGLQEGQDIPVPGVTRTDLSGAPKPVTVQEGGGATSTINVGTPKTTTSQDFDLTQIPLANVFNSLTSDERGLFDAMLQISGTNPEDVARKQQQLAPPGSGRSVFAAFGR